MRRSKRFSVFAVSVCLAAVAAAVPATAYASGYQIRMRLKYAQSGTPVQVLCYGSRAEFDYNQQKLVSSSQGLRNTTASGKYVQLYWSKTNSATLKGYAAFYNGSTTITKSLGTFYGDRGTSVWIENVGPEKDHWKLSAHQITLGTKTADFYKTGITSSYAEVVAYRDSADAARFRWYDPFYRKADSNGNAANSYRWPDAYTRYDGDPGKNLTRTLGSFNSDAGLFKAVSSIQNF